MLGSFPKILSYAYIYMSHHQPNLLQLDLQAFPQPDPQETTYAACSYRPPD